MELFIFTLEIIGTIAFASSGALTAIEKNMDILGVSILGMTTAVGGGIIRDLILGITPPSTFQNPTYAVLSIFISMLIFIFLNIKKYEPTMKRKQLFNKVMMLSDSLGLGIFTVVGVSIAYHHSSNLNLFLLIFVGVITGVGGGILRDVMAGNMPYIFVKHVYACASITGALICTVLWPFMGKANAMILGAVIVVLVRLLAAHYKWNLPKVKKEFC